MMSQVPFIVVEKNNATIKDKALTSVSQLKFNADIKRGLI